MDAEDIVGVPGWHREEVEECTRHNDTAGRWWPGWRQTQEEQTVSLFGAAGAQGL